jgi:hypothetical protein
MISWKVVEDALTQRRRSPQWLADTLDCKIQVVSNWKARDRIPPERYRAVATALDLSVNQLEGYEPMPWAQKAEWPFEDRALFDRVKRLSPPQLLELQGVLRKMVTDFESTGEEGRRLLEQTNVFTPTYSVERKKPK